MGRCAHQGGLAERNAMIDRTHRLPVVRQCRLLKLARSTAYYQPTPVSETTLTLMRRIDELHLPSPFAGARMLRNLLRQKGHAIGRRQVATLMRRLSITAMPMPSVPMHKARRNIRRDTSLDSERGHRGKIL
ncbi:MAG: IS3 family transposase [Nitrospira sp.]|nr:IS3 family transposase [Nitrospira sp.]